MENITISRLLKEKCKSLQLGIITGNVIVSPSSPELKSMIQDFSDRIKEQVSIDQITQFQPIKHSRNAYKALGKEPSRYRLSAEALLRRIVQGKGIYFINNLVDIINYISIKYYFSIGLYDFNKIVLPVNFTIGTSDDIYMAIGRGLFNIDNLPVFEDALGKYGSPTSDSERTKITDETKTMILKIIAFEKSEMLQPAIDETLDLLIKFANLDNYKTVNIE